MTQLTNHQDVDCKKNGSIKLIEHMSSKVGKLMLAHLVWRAFTSTTGNGGRGGIGLKNQKQIEHMVHDQ